MKIMFNQPIMQNNPINQQNNNKPAFQPQLKSLDGDIVQFSGNGNSLKVSQEVLEDLVAKMENYPEKSVPNNLLKNIIKVVEKGDTSEPTDGNIQIYTKMINNDPNYADLRDVFKDTFTKIINNLSKDDNFMLKRFNRYKSYLEN